MKVVINACYGGFNLSQEASLEYAKLSGFKLFGYTTNFEKTLRYEPKEKEPMIVYWLKEDIGDNPTDKELNAAAWFHDRDLKRDDKILIEVVERLGDKSNGMCSKLKVVEIPDGTDYVIEEYDGFEHVAEAHKTWG